MAASESLVARRDLDVDDAARRFAASYRWSRGYGVGAAKVLRKIRGGMPWLEASTSVYPEGSFGNGGGMRAPVIGLFLAQVTLSWVPARSSGRPQERRPR